MIQYTTCRDCGGLLHTTNNDTVHPLCTPRPTQAERLTEHWLAIAAQGVDELPFTLEAQMCRLEAEIEFIDTDPPRLLEAALAYAAWGWPVFPLKTRSKIPATRHGFKDATTDLDRIRGWWTRHPDNNIGLPTGLAFDVIDVDLPQGFMSYDQLLREDALPDSHGQVATSSGGRHLYVHPTGEGNGASLLPGIDYRGAGGYVVAPPSKLGERGRAWTWSQKPSPTITRAADRAAA